MESSKRPKLRKSSRVGLNPLDTVMEEIEPAAPEARGDCLGDQNVNKDQEIPADSATARAESPGLTGNKPGDEQVEEELNPRDPSDLKSILGEAINEMARVTAGVLNDAVGEMKRTTADIRAAVLESN